MKNGLLHGLIAVIKPFYRVILMMLFLASLLILIDRKENGHDGHKMRLALLQYSDSPLSETSMHGIIDGLASFGYIRDKDYDLSVSNAQGDIATLNMMVDAVITDRPDLVFVTSTPTLQVAAKKIKDLPVVFSVVADPLIVGAGKSDVDHLPNITGISTLGDFEGMIKWVRLINPGAKSIGTLFTPGESNSVKNMEVLKKYAERAGLKMITVPINNSQDIVDATLTLTSMRPDVICQIVDNLTSTSAGTIIKSAKDQGIPVYGFVTDQAKKGAVLVVSRDFYQAGVDAVMLAKKVFNGTSPADIPFQNVSKTNIIFNLEEAKRFHITIPEDILKRKDIIFTK
jgi:ABC-type uncharacterized transport system substrate-binding protein